jgi:hypothetical protein
MSAPKWSEMNFSQRLFQVVVVWPFTALAFCGLILVGMNLPTIALAAVRGVSNAVGAVSKAAADGYSSGRNGW